MNSSKEFFQTLDPGEGMLPRKRFQNLKLDARVYHEATNLLPPLDPPQPPPVPTETVAVSGPQNNFIRRKAMRSSFSTRHQRVKNLKRMGFHGATSCAWKRSSSRREDAKAKKNL